MNEIGNENFVDEFIHGQRDCHDGYAAGEMRTWQNQA
jgi:hypothetical protein